ncbi:MAG: hypothetical protein JNL21_10595 [Myxococcales bacterium]|nr:hypothetical protein [Myxococcales bacterium]
MALASCTGHGATLEPCAPVKRSKQLTLDSHCKGGAPYRTDVGCALDPNGTERVVFENRLTGLLEIRSILLVVDDVVVFESYDPLVLERETFTLATLPRRDYSLRVYVDTVGRSAPLCGYRHAVRSWHERSAKEGPLFIRLHAKNGKPLHEGITIRYLLPSGEVDKEERGG